ncbi:MAG TPA: hypothetical protein VH374_00570 [Polyangia bacterium]|jgi:hypothetical protein|nr:hypothetical protein [Polyangia bacterium]
MTNVDEQPISPKAVAPKGRPTWLVVLSSLTLAYGGLLLVSGLSALQDPIAAARLPVTQAMAPAQEVLARQLADTGLQILTGHLLGIRLRAAGSLVLAMALLYAAAAALSRDRHGRTVTLLAAWLGIIYQVASLPVVIPIARDYAAATAPLVASAMAADPPTASSDIGPVETPKPEAVAKVMRSVFVGIPIATALVGICGSVLLLVYYGGRRGRALYGLLPPRL